MIRVRGLHVVRPAFELGPLDWELPLGSHLAIIGPSGHGKTTLLWALAGTIASRGEISVGGARIDGLPPEARGMSMAPQGALLFPHLSVARNVGFGGNAVDVRALAGEFGFEELLGRSPRSLSGGQKMRVSLARAVAHPSQVLLLDEPLSGLDAAARSELLPKIAALAPTRTLLHVTHGLEEAAQTSSHVLAIVEGRMAAFGPTGEVLKSARSGPIGRWLTSAWP